MERFCSERFFVVELVVKDFFSLRFWVEKAELSGSGDRQTSWVWLLLVFFSLSLSRLFASGLKKKTALVFLFYVFFSEILGEDSSASVSLSSLALSSSSSHGSSLWHPLAVSQSFLFFCCRFSSVAVALDRLVCHSLECQGCLPLSFSWCLFA